MKKTEKIELRVDHAEKERLSDIARRRGLTVSDVVREALSSELGISIPNPSKWAIFVAAGATIVSVIALAIAGASFLKASSPLLEEFIFPKTASVSVKLVTKVNGLHQANRVSLDIPLLGEHDRDFEIVTADGETYRINMQSHPDEQSMLLNVQTFICQVEGKACDVTALPPISIQTRPLLHAHAETTLMWEEGTGVEVDFHTVTRQFSDGSNKPKS